MNHAIQRLHDDSSFRIITIVFGDNKQYVPEPLAPYIHITVQHEVDALYEIIRALPVAVGPVTRREDDE